MIEIHSLAADEVCRGYYIPPKPEILIDLQRIAEKDDPNPSEIANLISADVGLAAATLKTINSPFYGMAKQITDIRQAVMLLGARNIISLVSAYKLRAALSGKSSISLERFWDSASDVAVALVTVGGMLKVALPPEDLYTVGLFHDCGIPILAVKYPDYKEVLMTSNADFEQSITDIEEAHYTTNHAIVGYFVASSWGLPRYLCEAILQHHERDLHLKTHDTRLRLAIATLKVAENIVDRVRRNKENPDWPHYKSFALFELGISEPDYRDLEADVRELLL